MKQVAVVILVLGGLALCAWSADGPAASSSAPASTRPSGFLYPGAVGGALTHAKLAALPDGILLRSGDLTLTEQDISQELAKAPLEVQGQLKKNQFFLLEQIATSKLLAQEARAEATKAGKDIAGKSDDELTKSYLAGMAGDVKVTDEEIADFYKNNQDACGGAKLEQVRSQIEPYIKQQKQQEAVTKHVATMGQRMPIEVAAKWTRDQAILAQDNVVDKARLSGKPSLVDFGSKGCRPCDMLAPILETLKTKYNGQANVMFVSVVQEQVLAARYGVQSIPVQVFFDKDGKEVFRHTGFWTQDELEKQMAKLGVN